MEAIPLELCKAEAFEEDRRRRKAMEGFNYGEQKLWPWIINVIPSLLFYVHFSVGIGDEVYLQILELLLVSLYGF